MKTAVIYYSKHHGNTKKLLDEIAKQGDVTLIDAVSPNVTDLTGYDLIGFASGIYYSKFHKSVTVFAEKHLPENKKVFFIYTCGAKRDGYTSAVSKIASSKGAEIVDEYGCLGFDTFGPLKLVGGIAKGHPDETEISAAADFFKSICNK